MSQIGGVRSLCRATRTTWRGVMPTAKRFIFARVQSCIASGPIFRVCDRSQLRVINIIEGT